jgi:hypothetical protein
VIAVFGARGGAEDEAKRNPRLLCAREKTDSVILCARNPDCATARRRRA